MIDWGKKIDAMVSGHKQNTRANAMQKN
jgi:hypothetical protein